MNTACSLALLALLGTGTPAAAQEVVTELPDVELERIPPQYSYDVGMQVGITDITYWREEVPPWAALGFFFSWGAHIRGNDRIGPGIAVSAEGPIPLHATYAIEPTVRWDRVMGNLGVGASVGGAVLVHAAMRQVETEMGYSVSPVVAGRIGWSQGWTRVGRRLFIVAEPKLRYFANRPNWAVSVQIGSGHGY